MKHRYLRNFLLKKNEEDKISIEVMFWIVN